MKDQMSKIAAPVVADTLVSAVNALLAGLEADNSPSELAMLVGAVQDAAKTATPASRYMTVTTVASSASKYSARAKKGAQTRARKVYNALKPELAVALGKITALQQELEVALDKRAAAITAVVRLSKQLDPLVHAYQRDRAKFNAACATLDLSEKFPVKKMGPKASYEVIPKRKGIRDGDGS